MSAENWQKFYVEVYDEAGYQGTWEVAPAEGRAAFDEADRDAMRAQLEADPQFAGAEVVIKPEADGLTFGVMLPGSPDGPEQSGRDSAPSRRPARRS